MTNRLRVEKQLLTYTGPRVIVVGWDAGCWPYIEPRLADGLLPKFAQLLENGCFGVLNSTKPPMTPVAWTSIITGCNPGKHGVFNWWHPVGERAKLKPYDSTSVLEPNIFQILSNAGIKVGVVNAPLSNPPWPVNGFVLGGISQQNDVLNSTSKSFHPPGLATWAAKRHPLLLEEPKLRLNLAKNDSDLLKFWLDQENIRMEAVADMVQYYHPDLLWVHCHVGDYFGHRQPKDSKILSEAFRLIDSTIDKLANLADPDHLLLVISDHGQNEIKKFILLQNWLEQEGLLRFQQYLPQERFATIVSEYLDQLGASVSGEDWKRLVLNLADVYYDQSDSIVMSIADKVNHHFPGSTKEHGNINWEETQAYCCEFYGGFRINLKGRELQGIVDPADYEAAVDKLITGLSNLFDPNTGKTVGIRPLRADQIYWGEGLKNAPDIICLQTDLDYYLCPIHSLHFGESKVIVPINQDMISARFQLTERNYCGDHSNEGLFVFGGPRAQKLGARKSMEAQDVAPTILHVFGISTPSNMDGVAQTDLVIPFQVQNTVPKSDARISMAPMDSPRRELLISELRSLGYHL